MPNKDELLLTVTRIWECAESNGFYWDEVNNGATLYEASLRAVDRGRDAYIKQVEQAAEMAKQEFEAEYKRVFAKTQNDVDAYRAALLKAGIYPKPLDR